MLVVGLKLAMARMGESRAGCRWSFEEESHDQRSGLSLCSGSPGSAGIRAGAKAIVCWRGERGETSSSALSAAGRRMRMEQCWGSAQRSQVLCVGTVPGAGTCVCVCGKVELARA